MRFIIAPDWLMQLDNDVKLSSKQVKEIYGYPPYESVVLLTARGAIPDPEYTDPNTWRRSYSWSVGYIKNFLKLPTEINHEYKTQPLQKVSNAPGIH